MEYLNDKGIILCLPKKDKMLLIGALTIAIEEVDKPYATEADKKSVERLVEIRSTLIKSN